MTTELAPTAPAPQPGMEHAGDDGKLFVSSEMPQAPQSESQAILSDLIKFKAPQNVIDEWKKQNPETADTAMTPAEKEVAAEFPPANPADIDLGFVLEQLATPEGIAAKTQMETWITAAAMPVEMVTPFVNSVNETAKTLATMPANNRAIHAQMEQDKITRAVGGEVAYKAQLAEARVFLQNLDKRSPGVLDFIRAHPEVIDNSAMTQSILFRMAALDKVRRGGK